MNFRILVIRSFDNQLSPLRGLRLTDLCANFRIVKRAARGGILALLAAVLLSGCETVGFYHQAVWGQLALLGARTPVSKVLAAAETPEPVRQQLLKVEQILQFAEQSLHLPAQGRYDSYVALPRDYVVWNVFAAGPLSMAGDRWCYPVVGCAPYRGYFSEDAARRVAKRYAQRGFEVYVGGVPAYSTLGWFDDPVLSTFVNWPDSELANLLFHELAHGRIWVASDTAFNESFASFVAEQGLRQWHASQGKQADWYAWRERVAQWQAFRGFLLQAKGRLSEIYASSAPQQHKLAAKASAVASLRDCYVRHRGLLGAGRFDKAMEEHFNNAFLLSVGTYADWLPGFAALFAQSGEDWEAFYDRVEQLAAGSLQERTAYLEGALGSAERQTGNERQRINCSR